MCYHAASSIFSDFSPCFLGLLVGACGFARMQCMCAMRVVTKFTRLAGTTILELTLTQCYLTPYLRSLSIGIGDTSDVRAAVAASVVTSMICDPIGEFTELTAQAVGSAFASAEARGFAQAVADQSVDCYLGAPL